MQVHWINGFVRSDAKVRSAVAQASASGRSVGCRIRYSRRLPRFLLWLLVGSPTWLFAPTAFAQADFALPELDQFLNDLLPPLSEQEREHLASIPVSPREERQLGQQAFELLLKDLRRSNTRVWERGKDIEYLRALIRVVQPQMQQAQRYQRLKIYLIDSPITEARCFPGGLIVFYRGMLEFVENEAQLIGVISHELSHLDRGHALVRLRAWKQTQQQLANPTRSTDPRQMMGIGMQIARTLGRPFRPEDEAQADEDAVRWTWKTGYDPRELAKLFLRLHERDGMQPVPFPSFLRSHPMPIQRYRATRELAEQLVTDNPKAEIDVGVENLKRRIPRDRRRFDPD